MRGILEILEEAKNKKGYRSLGREATDAEILMAEQAIGVEFPGEYRLFLKNYGFVGWFGETLYGITADQPKGHESVVGATFFLRNNDYPPNWVRPPANAFVVGRVGNSYCWMYGKSSEREGEVSLFEDHYRNGSEYEYWKSFEDFLVERIKDVDTRILVGNPDELYM